jgi:hypothetical protein
VTPDETFEKRMEQAQTEVAREFGALDPEVVKREFERTTNELLQNARVMDFVPVLVRRHVRETLKGSGGTSRFPQLEPQV